MDRLIERSRGIPWRDALTASVTTCAEFWAAEQAVLRRLLASEVVEPDVTDRLRQREAWRSEQFGTILAPLTSPAHRGTSSE